MMQSVRDARVRVGVQNVPHFGLAVLSVLVCTGELVIGMHLHGKIPVCVDELHQHGQVR